MKSSFAAARLAGMEARASSRCSTYCARCWRLGWRRCMMQGCALTRSRIHMSWRSLRAMLRMYPGSVKTERPMKDILAPRRRGTAKGSSRFVVCDLLYRRLLVPGSSSTQELWSFPLSSQQRMMSMITVRRLTVVPVGHQCSAAGQLARRRRLTRLTRSPRSAMAKFGGGLGLLFLR